MARLTPAKIQELAEPIETIYANIEDELLMNIARHLRGNTTTWTAYWEVQKLAEIGQLTQENAAIIQKWIDKMPQELKDTMEATRKAALADLERQLAKAAADGYITPAVQDSVVQVLKDYADQATEKLNMTNTTMLQSSVAMYQEAVSMTSERASLLQKKAEATIGQSAANVISGAITRRQALAETFQQLSDDGITGFYDKAGREWSAEAYVNMVIRTTVHNTAVQSVAARMEDYGTTVFQVSSHAGARPLCYPYQGKFFSWDNTDGEITLGNGRTVHYEPLNSTSYGEPAGLFGINCGHYPIPIIPGVTIPHGADNIEPKAANDKAYQQSQQQRALERKIRAAKRTVAMAGSTATDKQKSAVREAQAEMRGFIEATGRARRYDREGIAKVITSAGSVDKNDVTGLYKKTATPKSGTVKYGSNYKASKHKNEIKTADWLHNTFGGEIVLLSESNEYGKKTSDYMWNGQKWELKNTTTAKSADSALRSAIKQIADNPGGVILDYGNSNASMNAVSIAIDERMKRQEKVSADVMVVSKEKVVFVKRYKK